MRSTLHVPSSTLEEKVIPVWASIAGGLFSGIRCRSDLNYLTPQARIGCLHSPKLSVVQVSLYVAEGILAVVVTSIVAAWHEGS